MKLKLLLSQHHFANIAIIFGVALIIYAILFVSSYSFTLDGQLTYPLFDDGMISLEYGRNLAMQGRFVSGNLENPTIGFTSYLWVLSLAGIALTGVSALQLPFLAVIWNVVILLVALGLTARLIEDRESVWRCAAFWFLTLSSPALLFWTLRGMEVPLAVLMLAIYINLAVALVERGQKTHTLALLALAALATPFARPDQAPIVLAFAALFAYHRRHRAAIIAVFALGVGQWLYTHLNLLLFAQEASNSYYLKITGVSPLDRVERGLSSLWLQVKHHWIYFSVIAVSFVWSLRCPKQSDTRGLGGTIWQNLRHDQRSIFLLTSIAVGFVVWIGIGGDGWEELPIFSRFLATLLPFIAVLFLRRVGPADYGLTGLRLIIPVFVFINSIYAISLIVYKENNDEKYSTLGYMIGKEFGRDVTIMNYWYGQPAYYSGLFGAKSIDGLGKIDPVVSKAKPKLKFKPGHDRWDHRHSIAKLGPDLILGMPCPLPHDLGFDCSSVWSEIVEHYGYTPHTAPEGYTLFVSPSSQIPDLNVRVERFNQNLAEEIGIFRSRL